jgi:hypothetical protein
MAVDGHTLPHHRLFSKLYYDVEQPTAYTSKQAIYHAAKKINNSITYKNVSEWFMSQPAATVWKQAKKRVERNPYIQVTKFFYKIFFSKKEQISVNLISKNFPLQVVPHVQYQLDVMDLSRYAKSNNKHRFCLVAICVMSRFAYAWACKGKSALEILKHVKSLHKSRSTLRILQTDEGDIFFV